MAEQLKTPASRIRLLLIDDEEGYLNVVSKRLKRRNIEAVTAKSGYEGVELLIKDDFDVCVLDLKMADIYGLELLKMFRLIAPQMPVIMLTGHGSYYAAQEALDVGAFAYLNKPCDLTELLEIIQRAYKHSSIAESVG
jgi:DNA-binding NtrC family response regulator